MTTPDLTTEKIEQGRNPMSQTPAEIHSFSYGLRVGDGPVTLNDIERMVIAAELDSQLRQINELRLQLHQQQDEVRRLREELAEAKTPDMWWDPESPEDAISDPQEAFDDDQFAGAGDTFRLWCAKRLPDQIYTITSDTTEGDDLSYRDATPEEAAEHIACEKAEKARRKAEMDAENARRRAALTPTATPAKENP